MCCRFNQWLIFWQRNLFTLWYILLTYWHTWHTPLTLWHTLLTFRLTLLTLNFTTTQLPTLAPQKQVFKQYCCTTAITMPQYLLDTLHTWRKHMRTWPYFVIRFVIMDLIGAYAMIEIDCHSNWMQIRYIKYYCFIMWMGGQMKARQC